MKILIVDDSKAMRMLVKRSLRMAGFGEHDTIEAENGKEGIVVVEGQQPDLVISDWNMPEMTGLEFLQTLRANDCSVNFGFVTTEASNDMRALAKEVGALFLVTKPFTPEQLRNALEPALED